MAVRTFVNLKGARVDKIDLARWMQLVEWRLERLESLSGHPIEPGVLENLFKED